MMHAWIDFLSCQRKLASRIWIPACAGITIGMFLPGGVLSAEDVSRWQVISEKSSIAWTANYAGKPVAGDFPAFSSDIIFDPAHLDKSSVTVNIETGKVKSSDKDAQENLSGGEWFASAKYPAAVFRSEHFKHISGDNYEAEGTLAIRDKTQKITLPFTVRISDHTAVMNGGTTIKRVDFGVGQGDWAKTDVVADEVKVAIHIEAKSN